MVVVGVVGGDVDCADVRKAPFVYETFAFASEAKKAEGWLVLG